MFDKEFPPERLERMRAPSEKDRIGAKIVLKVIEGDKFSSEVLEGVGEPWKDLAMWIQAFPINPYYRYKSPSRQREERFKELVSEKSDAPVDDRYFGSDLFHPRQEALRIKHAIQHVLAESKDGIILELHPELDPLKGGLQLSWDFFREEEDTSPDFLVEDILVWDEAIVLGGPPKFGFRRKQVRSVTAPDASGRVV